ncbi:MAG: FAD-binding oxidoreductase [Gemmatimonadales bacterium]
MPQAVAIPRDVGELAGLVQWAAAERAALVPRGAGSGMAGGNVGAGVIVDASRTFTDLQVDPDRRSARAGASVTWAAIAEAARSYGLRLPADPSSGAFATSGGMCATNAAGPRSLRYGSVRSWIDAVEVVTADGQVRTVKRGAGSTEQFTLTPDTRRLIARTFPHTRKNSSGYALDRFAESGDELDLLIGSEGTLGIFTAVHWRLDPIPAGIAGAVLGFTELDALGDAVPYLVSLEPAALELVDRTLLDLMPGTPFPGLACLLLVEFERATTAAARGAVGDGVRGLKHVTAHVETAVDRAGLEHLWAVRRMASPALARLPATRRSLQVIEDGCVPLSRLGEYVTGVRRAAARFGVPVAVFGHAGDGHVHVNALPDTTAPRWREVLTGLFDDVTDLVARLGGVPAGEHGAGRLRAGALARVYGEETTAVFAAVKRAYDPLSILNPGIIIPAADWTPLAAPKVGAEAAAIPDDVATRLREIERTAAWATPKLDLAH